ncbi:MAG: hypothetical protein U1F68_13805 [Gammaproteobacteria bacterium]
MAERGKILTVDEAAIKAEAREIVAEYRAELPTPTRRESGAVLSRDVSVRGRARRRH